MKLKNAPNMKKQSPNAFNALIIAGSQAWEFAKMAQAEHKANELNFGGCLPSGEYSPPIVLIDTDEQKYLSEVEKYRIAPQGVKHITLQQANHGEALSSEIIARICANLATNTQAQTMQLIDETGQAKENLTDYLLKTRKGETIAQTVAQKAIERTENAKQNEPNKTQPYIEKRTINAISGLYRITPKYDRETGELLSEKAEWLCGAVDVIGIGRSETEDFIVLQWQPEGSLMKVKEALPLRDLGEREGWKQLKARGLKIATKNYLRNELADYLQNAGDRRLWTITNATGWQNGAYILPNGEIIGEPETPVLFRSQSASFNGYNTAGTLESWQQQLGRYIVGNPSMMVGVAVALAAPLIYILNAESFGVHLFGGSTAGKTTIANIASSIYGHPDKTRLSWYGTGNALANEAAARNDCFMPLDEIGQGAKVKDVEQASYSLFNGTGKLRGAKEGGNRELQRWRIMAFSTGEIDLEGYLSQSGIKTNAGQLVRLLNVPITPAKHYHGLADGKTHADHLNQMSKEHYGVIGREWIKYLINRQNEAKSLYSKIKAKWLDRLPSDASPQVQRVAGRFAILETALQLSQHLTQWETDTNSEALLHSFNEWVNIFGLHSREEKQVIEQVNGWLLMNGARFIEVSKGNYTAKEPNNCAGFKELSEANRNTNEVTPPKYWVIPKVYTNEVIAGFNEKQASEILIQAKMLKAGKDKGYPYRNRLPKALSQGKTLRYYLLEVLDEEDEEQEDE